VLVATEKNGAQTDSVPIEIAADFSGAGGSGQGGPRSRRRRKRTRNPNIAADAAAVRVLGGLILNLMPCVFPVLSIKALQRDEQAQKHPAQWRQGPGVCGRGIVRCYVWRCV